MAMPRNSIQRRLVVLLGVIAVVAIMGVLLILPWRLYERDLRLAEVGAHRFAAVIQSAVGHNLMRGEDVGEVIRRVEGMSDVELELRALAEREAHPTGSSGRPQSDLDGTLLTYLAAPIVDDMGTRWLLTLRFDLSAMKRDSVTLILQLVAAVLVGAAAFSVAVFTLIKRSLIDPLQTVTDAITQQENAETPVVLPHFETSEMSQLASALARAFKARGQ